MNDAMKTDAPTAAAAQPIDGREAFRAASLVALDDCAQAGVPEIWLCDPDFVEWPLGRAEIVTALGRWVTPRRRLTLVAGSYDHLAQHCPRWVAWRRQWGHAVRCLQVREEAAAQMPTLLYGPPAAALRMHRMERVLRGRLYRDADDLAPLADVVDALTHSPNSSQDLCRQSPLRSGSPSCWRLDRVRHVSATWKLHWAGGRPIFPSILWPCARQASWRTAGRAAMSFTG